MSTPYTLMRCRMKDLISCFKACKVPIEEDENDSDNHNPKSSSIDHQKCQRDKGVTELGSTAENGGGGGGGVGGGGESPTSWQSCESEEDEYIVFYFRDDDTGVDVIEERGLEHPMCRKKLETGKINVDSKLNPSATEEMNKDIVGESSDSSTSSFAFPKILSEWTGSPVLMPRPEGYNKTRNVCIQCCKF